MLDILDAARSVVFTAATNSELLADALQSAADAVAADLEDMIAEDGKAAARDALKTAFAEP